MKEEEIVKRLREEAERDVPDVRDRVYAAASAPEGDVLVKTGRPLLWVAFALLAALVLAALLGIFLWRDGSPSAFKIVVSINPSVEFTLGDGKTVSATRSLNRDAAILLKDTDFEGETAEGAVLRFAALADSKHLIGADGISIRIEGGDGSLLTSVRASLERQYAQYSITDMDEAAFDRLIAGYDEREMGDFEDWLAREFEGQQAQFEEEILALLASYEGDLDALDARDTAAVAAFNTKYLKLGEDLTFEDGDETKAELLREYEKLCAAWERDPARALDELFGEFIDELEDVYEDRYERDDDDDDRDDDDRDDDDRDDEDDDDDDDDDRD